MDGTVRLISKPGQKRRVVYHGHKRVHGVKFQSVTLPNGIIGNMYADLSTVLAFSHISSIAASNSEGSSTAILLALPSSTTFLLCFFIRTRFTRSLTDLTETEKRGSGTALRFKAISSLSFALSLLPFGLLYGSTVSTSLTKRRS